MNPSRHRPLSWSGAVWLAGAAVAAAAPALAPAPPGASTAAVDDIRDIRPPVSIPNPWAWFWWGLALSLVAAGLCFWWRRWRRQRSMPTPVVVIPPHVRAKQRLEAALFHITDPNRFCTQVADTIRVYLEERFQLRAPERTTEEFLLVLRSSPHLLPDQKVSLGEFLQHCDLVKFARFEPTEAALRTLYESAVRLVDETQFASVDASDSTGAGTGSAVEPALQATPPSRPPLAGHPR
jgi:hypothetical protein